MARMSDTAALARRDPIRMAAECNGTVRECVALRAGVLLVSGV
jgi:hypothetical protein